MKYVLVLLILGACVIYPGLVTDGVYDFGVIFGWSFTAAFQIISSIWLYKDFVGWEKFESVDGLGLKRKKTL